MDVNARQLDGVLLLERQSVESPGKYADTDHGDGSLGKISCKKISLLTFRHRRSTYGRAGDFGKRNECCGPQVLVCCSEGIIR